MPRKLQRVAKRACTLLAKRYGKKLPDWAEKPKDPLGSLIAVILSQNTTDVNSARAYRALRKQFPAWEQVLSAKPSAIAKTIRIGGLANTKSKRIRFVLKEILRREGKLSLSVLQKLSPADAREYLISIKGVGPKTAAVVLSFGFGHPFFPVDTHIFRVARRVGFYDEKTSREKAHLVMDALVPDAEKQNCHINMISLGREICTPRNPACGECPILSQCNYGQSRGFKEWLAKEKTE